MSIRKRGKNIYQIVVYLGRDPETGKQIQDTVTFHGSPKAAEKEERRLLRERDLGLYVAPSDETVSEYLARWLKDYAKGLSGNTYQGYSGAVTRYIDPNIGKVELRKLRPANIKHLYAVLREQPARGGGTLSGHTILHVHRLLHEAFRHAVREGSLAVNPCDAVDAPKREDVEMKTITAEQTAVLLQGLQGTRYYTPVLVAVTCGLRRGELLALRWRDVNLKARTLSVAQALEQTKDGIRTKPPKTPKSRRQLVISPLVVATLKEHRKEQNAQRLEQGNTWKDNDLVFPAPDGGFWSPSHFSRMFTFHRRRLGIDCTLHGLRHTHATHMLQENIHPKIVSARLGHSKVGFTLDTYTHVIDGMDQEAADKTGGAIRAALAQASKKPR